MNKDSILLNCFNVSKYFKEGKSYSRILQNINFLIRFGEMIALVGKSGSGKSTLLNILGGLDYPTGGEVIFNKIPISKLTSNQLAILRNRDLGFVYQFHHLLSDFTALENVAMPLLIRGENPGRAKKLALKTLKSIGLEDRALYFPSELSGGEKQRVSICRSIINNPLLVLADEPTGNLDNYNSNIVFELLFKINKEYNTSFLIATHDLFLVNKLNKKLKIENGTLFKV